MSETPHAPLKQCSKCPNSYPATLEFFPPDKRLKSGMRAECRECRRDSKRQAYGKNKDHYHLYQRQNYLKHREQLIAYQKQHRKMNWARIYERIKAHDARNIDQMRARRRQYYLENKERLDDRSRQNYYRNRESRAAYYKRHYQSSDKDQLREYARKRRAENRELFRVYSRRHKARKRLAEGTHTTQDIQRQYDNQKGKCYYCRKKVGKVYHVDHVIPLSRGGSNGPENLVIACPACNLSKHAKLPWEWPDGGRLL